MVKYNEDQLSRIFHALGHSVRRSILQQIVDGTTAVVALAQPFQISLVAVSKHLKVLEKAGLIKRRKEGREYHFEPVLESINTAEEWIQSYSLFWNKRLRSLEDII
jgi:DNA-binding transcriptional ArsR family regulator